jgi:Super-infection exclusion protein B
MPDFLAWVKAVFEWIKSPKRVLIAWIVLGAVLVAPNSWLDVFHATAWVAGHNALLGLFFLICTVTLLVEAVWEPAKRVANKRHIRKRIETLSADQYSLLAEFVAKSKSTLYFQPQNGAVRDLENKGILYRSSEIGSAERGFPYTITTEAAKFLEPKTFQKILLKTGR